MNGLGSAGVVKGLDLSATTIKEAKRLFANVYLALELVNASSSYLLPESRNWIPIWKVSAFSYDFNYDTT